MASQKKLILLVIFAAVFVAVLIFMKNSDVDRPESGGSVINKIFNSFNSVKKMIESKKTEVHSDQTNSILATPQTAEEKKFEIFMDEEAERLEDQVADPEVVAKKYKAQAQALTPVMISGLSAFVLKTNENIRKRILGVYLLIQNDSKESFDALKEIVFDESEDFQPKPVVPHSFDEILRNRNDALFNMAAEEWLKRALSSVADPQAFMQDLARTATSERLKRFLQRKLKEG